MKTTIKKLFSGRIVIWIIILVLVILLSYIGRLIYINYRYPENKVLNGVPGNAILVVEGTGFSGFAEVLGTNPLWHQGFEETQYPDHFRMISDELKEATGDVNGLPSSLLNDQSYSLALIPRKQGGPGILVLLQLGRGIAPTSIHNTLYRIWPTYREKRLLEITYHERVLPNGDALYLAIKDGLVIASCDREVFELAYYTLESGNSIMKDSRFVNALQQLSKSQNRVPRLYLSHEGLYGWFSRFMNADAREMIALMPETGSWSAMELLFDEQGLHAQGFTHIPESGPSMAEVLKPNGAKLSDPAKILPYSTLFYDQIATDGFDNFYEQYINRYIKKYKGGVADYTFQDLTADSLMTVLTKLDIRSLTTAVVDIRDTTHEGNSLILIHAGNLQGAEEDMLQFADSLKGFDYQGFAVYPLLERNIIPAILGDRYRLFEEAFFTIYQDYLIIAPGRELMMATINSVMLNRTLSSFPGYSESIEKVNSELSQRYYFNRSNGELHLFSKIIPSGRGGFEKFLPYMPQQLVVSFLKEQDVILTDIVVLPEHGVSVEPGEHELVLDDIPSTPPVLMNDHRDGETKVLMADLSGYLYLINRRGGIEWKTEPIEPPVSTLEVIDLYKNGRRQCLFLSKNMLHIIQADGNYVKGYPVRLPSVFGRHLSVFDYEKNGNYRIIYDDVNDRLVNIDVSARRVAGWVTPEVKSVSSPVSYHKIAGLDILVATDSSGNTRYFDRRGNERFNSGGSCKISSRSAITVTYSLGVPHLSFLDREGHICQVSSAGSFVRHETIKFSGNPVMLEVPNMQNDGAEIVVAGPGSISVYDDELKMTALIQLQSFTAVSLQAVLCDNSFLCSGIDNFGIPFLISREDHKLIRFTDKNFDGVLVWRQKNGDVINILRHKGSLVQIGYL